MGKVEGRYVGQGRVSGQGRRQGSESSESWGRHPSNPTPSPT